MAYSFGTATDLADLHAKLVTFLTTDATLTGLGHNWTLMQTISGETHLRAPGFGGENNIYVQLWQLINVSTPYYNLGMSGSVGYAAGQTAINQPGVSPNRFYMLCTNSSMKYWFFADGRHFKVFVQVNTTYQNMFAGLLLPNGTSDEIPYPMYLGATCSNSVTASVNSSVATYDYASFFDPAAYANYRAVDGTWKTIRNHYEQSGSYTSDQPNGNNQGVWPWSYWGSTGGIRECFNSGGPGGPYPLFQAILGTIAAQGGPNIIGYLSGVFYTSGFSQASENTITVGGDTYIVFQSHRWTHRNAFCAIKVE